jgi:hypothetical protein
VAAREKILKEGFMKIWSQLALTLAIASSLHLDAAEQASVKEVESLANKMFIESEIMEVSRNHSPSYGVDEEYSAQFARGGWLCCQQLSQVKLKEKTIRCTVSYPGRNSGMDEVVPSAGFYWLRALHQKELDKRAVFWERVQALGGSLQ